RPKGVQPQAAGTGRTIRPPPGDVECVPTEQSLSLRTVPSRPRSCQPRFAVRDSRFAVRWLLRDPANVLVPTNLKSKIHNRSELLSNHHICCEFCAAFGLLPPSYGRQRPTP